MAVSATWGVLSVGGLVIEPYYLVSFFKDLILSAGFLELEASEPCRGPRRHLKDHMNHTNSGPYTLPCYDPK